MYIAVMALDPAGVDQARWTVRCKAALNALDIEVDVCLSAHL
ncbi:hypothetical protein [Glutamicibacter sp.]